MINFIKFFIYYLLIGFTAYLFIAAVYYFLKNTANKAIEQKWQQQWQALEQKSTELKQQEDMIDQKMEKAKADVKAISENLLQQKNEITVDQQKAAETFINAEKIRETAEKKLQQIQQENIKLRQELTAARQRAKRLAKKMEAGA